MTPSGPPLCKMISVLTYLVLLRLGAAAASLSQHYQRLDAEEKSSILWDKIMSTSGQSREYPTRLEQLQFILVNFNTAVKHVGDEFPTRFRKKTIHPVGSHALAEFVVESAVTNDSSFPLHPFTGLFQGAPYVVLRYSFAKEPEKDRAIPALAVKILRDQQPSGNFFALHDTDGQTSGNVFLNELKNHFPESKVPTQERPLVEVAVERAFQFSFHFPKMVGLSDIASFDARGQPVQKPKFPFQLILVPNPELKERFASSTGDSFIDDMAQISVGTKLHDVYALESPESDPNADRILVGALKSTSVFVPSLYGDETLFFQHQLFDDDLDAMGGEWEVKEQTRRLSGCPFGHN